jgi:hypothetical protein
MLEHLKELVITVITLLGSLAAIYLKYLLDNKKSSGKDMDNVTISIAEQDLIYGRLQAVQERTKADRVYIIQFHTGGVFKSGKAVQSYSVTHEVVAPGTSRHISLVQNVLLSQYINTFKEVISKGRAFFPDINALPEIDSAKVMLAGRGIQSYYGALIKDLDDNLLGVLILNYVHSKYEMTEDEFRELQHDADSVSGYLFVG